MQPLRTEIVHGVHACGTDSNACGSMRFGDWKLLIGRWANNFNKASWGIVDRDRGNGYRGASLDMEIDCGGPPPTDLDVDRCRRDYCLFVS